ncbi:ABC-type branched-subunit amino acid transport system substrate-binding protein [Nocardioides aromaticivorans]|uniref:ABC-type branched-subunit amino acid transport system substrate-binding protein n=1 Tax=Nocardioides aromaticivorans TaxID=200618 RepID=A0A7Z0CQ02_9ACTN|nr:ABC transporter substrate-binding protein [Nocardioides aromaticivorans]NYI46455.1 ABC-type branched-subunit amino acid transport system substrate-binding protein [Nocardioides aromaticivorans]
MSLVRLARLVGASLLVLLLAACGSQLDPDTVARASGDTNGSGNGGQGVADGGTGDTGAGGDTGADDGAAAGGDTGSGSGSSGSGGTGSSGSGGSTGGGGGKGSATGGVKAGSCAGFKNQKGITDKTITLANISDISGPVPGIFESAQQATAAYIKYFNATGGICGRKLELVNLDSRADAGADQQAYVKACDNAFAAVGSMSAFDSGGAGTANACGLPDLRAVTVNPERQACKSCFAAYAIRTNIIPDSAAKWLAQKYPSAVKNAAVMYVNAGAAPVNAKSMAAGYEKGAGWDVKYLQGIDVAEFNYAPYVQQMKDKGIKAVAYQGPYQFAVKLKQAMQQQGFKPDFYLQDPTIYDRRYLDQAGSLAEGDYIYAANDLFENKGNAEVQLYLSYLQQVKPGAIPNYYGLYAWSATRLFVEKAIALGGKLNRASLVQAVRSTTNWTGNGAHTPMNLGSAKTPPCLKVAQYKGGRWQQVSPGSYMCGRVVDTGIGG